MIRVDWKFFAISAVIIVMAGYLLFSDFREYKDSQANEQILEAKINELQKQLTAERNLRMAINSRIDSANRVSQNLSGAVDSLTTELKKVKGRYKKLTPSELEILMEKRYGDKN